MRVTIVIPSLACGGAERAATAIASYWAERGVEVTLLTFEEETATKFYDVHPLVKQEDLALIGASRNLMEGLINNVRRLFTLRKAINKSRPDFVISFLVRTNIRTLIATLGTPYPVIISEQTDPIRGNPGSIWLWLRRWIYPLADQVIAHTQQAAQFLRQSLHCNVTVIPNPVPLRQAYENPLRANPVKVAAVGALEAEKGFDLLLRSFAGVAAEHPDLTLNVFGEGSQRQELEGLREELGLTNRVFLPGRVKDIFSALREADLFVMPSRMEGFGNALCEAMACGLPVIASDCMGPSEIVRHGVDGILVPTGDVERLEQAMSELLNDPHKRQLLASQASAVMQRVSLEAVMTRWDDVLAKVSQKR